MGVPPAFDSSILLVPGHAHSMPAVHGCFRTLGQKMYGPQANTFTIWPFKEDAVSLWTRANNIFLCEALRSGVAITPQKRHPSGAVGIIPGGSELQVWIPKTLPIEGTGVVWEDD